MVERVRGRLGDEEVHERLGRLDALLGQLEEIPGPTAQSALDAVQLLAEVYGEALARVLAAVRDTPAAARSMCDDELLGHLFVMHDLHPDSVEQRVANAVESLQSYVGSHGGSIEFVGIEDGVAKVALAGSCGSCSSSATTLDLVVKEAVLAAAVELSDVEATTKKAADPLIPAASLLHRPSLAGNAGRSGSL
ncbi:MAG: NifU family protein [Acidothermaceae bacterium]